MPAAGNRTLVGFLVGSIAGAGALVGVGTAGTPSAPTGPRNVTPEELSDTYDSLGVNVGTAPSAEPDKGISYEVKTEDGTVKIVTRMYDGLCLASPPIGFSGQVGPECEQASPGANEETVPAT